MEFEQLDARVKFNYKKDLVTMTEAARRFSCSQTSVRNMWAK